MTTGFLWFTANDSINWNNKHWRDLVLVKPLGWKSSSMSPNAVGRLTNDAYRSIALRDGHGNPLFYYGHHGYITCYLWTAWWTICIYGLFICNLLSCFWWFFCLFFIIMIIFSYSMFVLSPARYKYYYYFKFKLDSWSRAYFKPLNPACLLKSGSFIDTKSLLLLSMPLLFQVSYQFTSEFSIG